MKIDFLCRNYEASDKLKDVITKKVDRLDKFFEDDTKVKIVLKEANNVQTMELTIAVSGGVLRAEVSGKNMYELIDQALPKLEKQIIKHHSKMKDKKFKVKDFVGETEKTVEPEKQVVRSKAFELAPMTVEDAIEEMELVGHEFYVFLNRATGNVSVLYTRRDGNYGLIEGIR
ncbi:MAG: ribosome-associated translation inhibitor RaiA [Firmicutes bacterium]|nr:ribosome-associated translation inhibitor RaiA [Bacillota bacterium]